MSGTLDVALKNVPLTLRGPVDGVPDTATYADDGTGAGYTDGAPSKPTTPEEQAAMRGTAGRIRERENRADAALERGEKQLGDLRLPPQLTLPPAPEAQHTDPMSTWGSMAMMFAMFGSLATRRPFTTALNAAAALNNAVAAGDHEHTQEAFNKWKIESENAQKMAQWEHERFSEQLSQIKTGVEFAREYRPTATAFKDELGLRLIDAGEYDKALALYTNRSHAAGQLTATRQAALDNVEFRKESFRLLEATDKELQEAKKSGDPTRIAAAQQAFDDANKRLDHYNRAMTPGPGFANADERARSNQVKEDQFNQRFDELKQWHARQLEQTDKRLDTQSAREAETERHNRFLERLADLRPESEAAKLQIERARLEETQRYHRAVEEIARARPGQTVQAQRYDATVKTAIDATDRAIQLAEQASGKSGPPVTGLFGAGERLLEFGGTALGITNNTPATDFQGAIRQVQAELPGIISFGHMSSHQKAQMDAYVSGLGSVTSAQQALNQLKRLRATLEDFKRNPPPDQQGGGAGGATLADPLGIR